MSWRPEAWENPHHRVQKFRVEELLEVAFEAGADAILEALRESGFTDTFYTNEKGEVCNSSNMPIYIPAEKPIRGTLAFIPEEEIGVKVPGNSQG